MSDQSPRFALPFIVPGQAQKELFHNEALLRVDALLHLAVEEGPAAAPPPDPQEGQCWIVAAGAAGAWAGQDHGLALWSGGGWRFVAPQPGTTAWNKADAVPLQWTGSAWSGGEWRCAGLSVGGRIVVGERRPAVPSPSGGTIIDAEARAAIDALIATLMSHGLID
ncbi:MAG: DUF2793 domain-containing protein [Alphaproteobacteria bacterium]|nr:DUF2793 domain-containing protein [Alphaproteobacteria bacterium]MBV9371119.1 DUF2793 domain-containing protein [Alphaproteobacteria bacterium]MBV9900771.1 DUF2793 domain-containing protein [Alphaproteobacteria bacterium]